MFIMIIDTEDSNTLAIHSALGGVFGPVDVDSLRRLALSPADGQTARSITGDAVADAVVAQQETARAEWEAAQADVDRRQNPPIANQMNLQNPFGERNPIDPTDHLISPGPSLAYTTEGQVLLPLDMGNGQVVYVPQSVIPEPVEPIEQYPSAPAEPTTPPYLIAQPFTTDPTDNLIPQNGFDPFQQFAPRVPTLYQNMPQEPSSDELQVWAAQQRADTAARFQQQQFAEMQARGIQGQVPPADFTGFPQTPQVQYQPPVPNI